MSAPPIAEPALLERLAMDDAAFLAFMGETLRGLPPRPFTPEVLSTALGYPWARPARSYRLDGERVDLLDDLGAAERDAVLAGAATGPDGAPRFPLLAFGSNGAPETLARKFAHFGPQERRVLVLAGELEGFDVGAAAHPTAYGSMPAALFASPGTRVRAAVLWVSAAQFTQLSWTEVSYRLGRLAPVRFVPDQPGPPVEAVFAYASRWGAFCPDGEPVALAAIPAEGRRAPALTQRALLDRAASLVGLASAEALVRAIFEEMPALAGRTERLRALGRPLDTPAWTPWPAAA